MGFFTKWFRNYAIVISKGKVYLKTFLISGDATKKVKMREVASLHKSEFKEYIEDTDSWVSLRVFLDECSSRNKWTGIGRARVEVKLLKLLTDDVNDQIWFYKGMW